MLSPYVIARQAVYWKFPSSVTRLAYVAEVAEETKIAWQASDDTLWMLKAAPDTWIAVGGGGGGGGSGTGATLNMISSDATIFEDESYIVVSYIQIDADLIIDGNLGILG